MNMLIRESDNILFREDDIPPFSADPEAHAALRNLWTQRLHIEETLDNLLRNPLDIDIDDEFKRLDSAHNVINRQMFKIYQFSTVLVHDNGVNNLLTSSPVATPCLSSMVSTIWRGVSMYGARSGKVVRRVSSSASPMLASKTVVRVLLAKL
jgi:hypothetical protein